MYMEFYGNMDRSRKPDEYVLTRVTFGDKTSGTIAILAHETTKLNDKYRDTGNQIVRNFHVDDIFVSCFN